MLFLIPGSLGDAHALCKSHSALPKLPLNRATVSLSRMADCSRFTIT
jgi:hypothetical protein